MNVYTTSVALFNEKMEEIYPPSEEKEEEVEEEIQESAETIRMREERAGKAEVSTIGVGMNVLKFASRVSQSRLSTTHTTKNVFEPSSNYSFSFLNIY
tara:strand:+ start:1805 stop:2098 length:294 start_codon:yes stop_codon:yes gene_type:complete